MMKNGEIPKSFIDNIQRNTLMIRQQKLTKGAFESLIEAFQLFGPKLTKIILDTNQFTDSHCTRILNAVIE